MRTLILHAGLPKCGSSSIQRSLYAARDRLAARGLVYWDIGPNHSEPLKALSRPYCEKRMPGHLRARYGSDNAIEASLRACLARPAAFTVLSAEGMGRVKGPGKARAPRPEDGRGRLRAAVLAAGFDRLRIVIYVRPPLDWWNSLVQQRTKTQPRAEAETGNTSYRALMEPVLTLFPEAEAELRLFDPAGFAGGSLLADFLDAAGIPAELAADVEEVRANPSLSAEATDFLDRMQRQARGSDPIGRWFVERYLRPYLSGGGRFGLPRETLAAMIEANRDDIAWLSERMGRDMTPVLPEERAAAEDDGDEAEDRRAAMVLQLVRDLGRLRSAESLREAAAALDAGRSDAARRSLSRALNEWPRNAEAQALLGRLDG
ncbi:hypothetical protein GI374_04770 [Paracoccus sp. S-4012]|uniref:hypothetical protein n=1 Tax=Paracoccus sp. S-4012 TaxID=2665648 RepID=UPI0012B0A131|nr:hypothetical protein [Paracoccus sp. S-4012]MRX49774.1 hypothetical protein [Paracoccus sp. S-4012]